jgi:hypothetical protein
MLFFISENEVGVLKTGIGGGMPGKLLSKGTSIIVLSLSVTKDVILQNASNVC